MNLFKRKAKHMLKDIIDAIRASVARVEVLKAKLAEREAELAKRDKEVVELKAEVDRLEAILAEFTPSGN